MTDRETLTPAESRARDAVRALSAPAADPAFRERLKREFTTGAIVSPFGEGAGEAPLPGSRRNVVRGPWRAPWAQPFVWAAAAAVLVLSMLGINRGPAWQVSGDTGAGIAIVDRVPIPMNHTQDLAAALRPGSLVQVPEGAELEVMTPGNMVLQITAGTEAVLPPSPGRWFRREIAAELHRGELRITTGARFHGARLAIATPEATIEVTGTTLAVIREPLGTCVCVLEGKVMVGPKGEPMAEVTSGRRRFVFNDNRAPESDDMRPMERVKLGMFREQKQDVLRDR